MVRTAHPTYNAYPEYQVPDCFAVGKEFAMPQKIQLQEAFNLALSLMLFYWLALYMDWELSKFGALAIVVTSLSTSGASLNKGVMRVTGTGIGALAGFVLLSWFSQSPLGMLLATAVYLVFVGYFIQTTRQGDTWFNAGLLAVAVWSSSYMQIDTAFHIATNRFLETAAGVLLFTVVSALLWPRTSGAALQQQGQALWEGMQELFKQYRRQLSTGAVSAETAELRPRLAGEYQQMLATLDAAYSDTPRVGTQKRSWEILRRLPRAGSGYTASRARGRARYPGAATGTRPHAVGGTKDRND